jgi:hypothetical protein
MPRDRRRIRSSLRILLLIPGLLAALPTVSVAADLQEDAARAYDRYIHAAEARMAREEKLPDRFLHIESLPPASQRAIWLTLQDGGVWLNPLGATDENGNPIPVPHATLMHWTGDIFFPGASLEQVLGVLQDFDQYQNIYKPEIVRSQVLSRSYETYRVSFRLRKDTPWVNPTFHVDSTVIVARPDANHACIRSVSTRIAQVEDAGKPDEHEDSPGHDGGYLWRFDTYWRLEARAGGVVGEWEAITLSRDIPFLLRWLVRPFVARLARQIIRDELVATRAEIERREHAGNPKPQSSNQVLPAGRGSRASSGMASSFPIPSGLPLPPGASRAFSSRSSASSRRASPL